MSSHSPAEPGHELEVVFTPSVLNELRQASAPLGISGEGLAQRLHDKGLASHATVSVVSVVLDYVAEHLEDRTSQNKQQEDEFREKLLAALNQSNSAVARQFENISSMIHSLEQRMRAQGLEALQYMEIQRSEAQRREARRMEEANRPPRFSKFAGLAMAAVSLTAIAVSLTSSYPAFINAVRQVFRTSFWDWIIPSALAQTGSAVATSVGGINLVVIFLFSVYSLLGLAYVVTLFGVFFARDMMTRTHATEVFKGLNAFFLGLVSGKIV